MIHHPFPIVLGLGSNLGPGRETLDQACHLLDQLGAPIVQRSRLYHGRPWGGVAEQPDYLNAAVTVATRLRPLELLDLILHIEFELGRRRRRRWGPRRLDIDLLLYGNLQLRHPRLELPHPRLARRDFVLAPLIDLAVPPPLELAPRGWGALLRELPPGERVIYHSERWMSR